MNKQQGERFIENNFAEIGLAAYREYLSSGRGIITLDLHGVPDVRGAAAEMGYVDATADEEVQTLVARYDPETEFVCLARFDDEIGIGVYAADAGGTFRELMERRGGRK